LGSGVRRIIKLVKEHLNEDVGFENTENEFVIKIPRKTEWKGEKDFDHKLIKPLIWWEWDE